MKKAAIARPATRADIENILLSNLNAITDNLGLVCADSDDGDKAVFVASEIQEFLLKSKKKREADNEAKREVRKEQRQYLVTIFEPRFCKILSEAENGMTASELVSAYREKFSNTITFDNGKEYMLTKGSIPQLVYEMKSIERILAGRRGITYFCKKGA